jgi:hypothetical protein
MAGNDKRNEMLEAALAYAARGWPVFPVPPGTKASYVAMDDPAENGEPWGATTDPAVIRRYFATWPHAGIGFALFNGIFVLDADTTVDHDHDGIASRAMLEAEHGALPPTLTARSGTGGEHQFFRSPPEVEVRNKHGVAPGLDVKGAGGMVVLPPTRTAKGQYAWVNDLPIAPAPDWLVALALARRHRASGGGDVDDDASGVPCAGVDLEEVAAAMAALPNATLDEVGGDVNDPRYFDRRDRWLPIMMGLHSNSAFGGDKAGLRLYVTWMRKHPKYDNAEALRQARETWNSFCFKVNGEFSGSKVKEVTIGTVFYHASEAVPGWRDRYHAEAAAHVEASNHDPGVHAYIMAEFEAARAAAASTRAGAAAEEATAAAAVDAGATVCMSGMHADAAPDTPLAHASPSHRAAQPAPEAATEAATAATTNGGAAPSSSGSAAAPSAAAAHALAAQAARAAAEPLPLTPFAPRPAIEIPPRRWLHAKHYIRGHVVMTVAPGGYGKSSLVIANAIEMALGRGILGPEPTEADLRVGYWNAEDEPDEVERRIAAFCQHHDIDHFALAGRLFVGRRLPAGRRYVKLVDGGIVVNRVMFDALTAFVRDNKIDCLILDPFVAFHGVPENDNNMMETVASEFARLAEKTRACVELTHHTRKSRQGDNELTEEDSRGASAVSNVARSVRILNRMTKDEAEKLDVPADHRSAFLRIERHKRNMAPPEKATWISLASVALANGDDVQAVERWAHDARPAAAFGSQPEIAAWAQQEVGRQAHKATPQSADWFGYAVAAHLRLDLAEEDQRKRVSKIISRLEMMGAIEREERRDPDRRKKYIYYRPGPWNPPAAAPQEAS